ncbi:MAG: hypothetical protein ABIQ31_23635 [Ferruginibacter sp.]
MKKQPNTLFNKFSRETLADLTKEVRETIAVGLSLSGKKTFTAADLWNIQRRRKSMVQRRFLF